MIALVAKLLIAHLAGDFILFRERELKEKGKSLWESRRLLLHSVFHFVFAYIALWDPHYWYWAAAIGASHYLIDAITRTVLSERPQWAFGIEQVLHLVLLFVVASIIHGIYFDFETPWTAIAGLIAVTFPAAKFIEVFLSQWPPTRSADKIKGLVNAGLWIGILERILIYTFIMTGHWEGIGFLLAAKSVFRFGDLTNSKDVSLTEYIMVGTLLSFSLAVITGLITTYFIAN